MGATPDAADSAATLAGARGRSVGGGDRPDRPKSAASSHSGGITGRIVGTVIAVTAAAWLVAASDIKRFDSGLLLRPVAVHMMAGEPYDPATISAVDTALSAILSDPVCDHQALQDLAVVRAALAEAAFQGEDADLADKRLTKAQEAAKASISCSPTSTRAWTILAWVEHIRNEDTPLLRTYLRKSHSSGPLEGWSLVRRMEILLELYPKLDDEETANLKQAVNWLVTMGMSEFVGEHYISAKPEQRLFIRDILAAAPERMQKRAADIIRNGGEDIDLPMVEALGSRPWK